MLTDDQRAHAIEAASAHLAWWWRMTQTDDLTDPRGEASWWEQAASAALTALLDAGYHVLHPDDVTEEIMSDELQATDRRLVTRWEPITDPADPQKETT